MAGFIIVADQDTAYAHALADRVHRHVPTCQVEAASDEPSLMDLMLHSSCPPVLIITESHFRMDRLPDGSRLIIPLQNSRMPNASADPDVPTRLGSIRPILKRLDQFGCFHSPDGSDAQKSPPAIEVSSPPANTPFEPVSSCDDRGNKGILDSGHSSLPVPPLEPNLPRVILMMTQTTVGRDTRYADERCRALAEGGTLLHYLPLMPNYYCSLWRHQDTGSSFGLTDLLLRVRSGGLSTSELGAFESMDLLGRLQFRPTDRADDLAHARSEDLYRLCSLLRERTLPESGSILVIETAGLAFKQIRPILALCDQIEVIFPGGDRYGDDMLRREIGDVLTDLPASCRVVRVPDRPETGRPATVMRPEVG